MRKIQKGDKVQVITGKYKGTVSEVEQTLDEKFIVKGVNVVKRAVKGQGFVEKTMPIQKSNVMYYCAKCKKPVRLGILLDKNGKKVRVCKKCGSQI